MNYIIFDLEWNNAYNHATHKSINEIIEIGAIKLDRNLNVVDTFKQLIKPQVSKRFSSRFRNLTQITIEEVRENGIDFKKAIDEFALWSKGEDCVFMSWSNSDLYVIISNFIQFFANTRIDFITNYCDAQKYCMSFIENSSQSNQISLSNCAAEFGVDIDTSHLHRALSDCYVTLECLKKVFDEKKIKEYITPCDSSFFERLVFKPYFIKKPVSEYCNLYEREFHCPECDGVLHVTSEFREKNNTLSAASKCKSCKKKFWIFVRMKKLYDDVIFSERIIKMNKSRQKS